MGRSPIENIFYNGFTLLTLHFRDQATKFLSKQVDELKLENKKLQTDIQTKMELLEKKLGALVTPVVIARK